MNHNQLYADNESLVGYMYNKHKDLYRFWEPDDLLQELRCLLWVAIKKWKPKRGKLSTLYWHICKNRLNSRYRKWTDQFRLCNLRRENYEHVLCNMPDKASSLPYNALLTENAIRILWRQMELNNIDILERYYIGGDSINIIARQYGVTKQAIDLAIKRETCKMRRSKFAADFIKRSFY